MLYEWSAELETGNTLIDAQHKQLIQAFNGFLDACRGGKGSAEIDKTLKFLVDYTVKHFADEEKLQVKHNYPDYENHKKKHEAFKQLVNELAEQLKKEGPTLTLVTKMSRGMGDWLLNHIKREDKKIAEHIRTIGA